MGEVKGAKGGGGGGGEGWLHISMLRRYWDSSLHWLRIIVDNKALHKVSSIQGMNM